VISGVNVCDGRVCSVFWAFVGRESILPAWFEHTVCSLFVSLVLYTRSAQCLLAFVYVYSVVYICL
jgi:hypothetical protein